MSGQIVYKPKQKTVKQEHACLRPHPDSYHVGSIWRCDDCMKYSIVRRSYNRMGERNTNYWIHMTATEVLWARFRCKI